MPEPSSASPATPGLRLRGIATTLGITERSALSMAAGPFDGPGPERLEDVPRRGEQAGSAGRVLARSGYRLFQLGVDQGPRCQRPRPSGLDLTVDAGARQPGAAPHGLAQVDTAEPGAGHVDGAELRAAEVNALNRKPCKSA